jgi:hypothetical protein
LDPLPDDVRQFLEAHIDSIEQLELLRVLGDDPSREWKVHEIAARVQAAAELAEAHVAALHGRGLLLREEREGEVYCRYGPQSEAMAEPLRRLLEQYKERPVTMIRLVYSRPASSLRSFSDAFKFRKE